MATPNPATLIPGRAASPGRGRVGLATSDGTLERGESMSDFQKTRMGRRYHEHSMPELVRQLERLSDLRERFVERAEDTHRTSKDADARNPG